MQIKIAVIGLGYVGLPLALEFAKKFPGTVGFDIDERKVAQLQKGIDVTGETPSSELKNTSLLCTTSAQEMRGCNFFVVGVPTPVDENKQPDLSPLYGACRSVASVLSKGSIVVFESTVYPGVTEEICGPMLEKLSGLKQGVDFKLGYSPERINPGDKEHLLTKVIKVVSGEDAATLEVVASAYGAIIEPGVYRASSIKVAEAAKVIENTQRDLNIALMNELAIIFDRMGISTKEVLDAASTKWNFLRFSPGLVGGHCIGVDPYYLTTKAQQLGYHPQVILAGRRINDDMGVYVAQRIVKGMVNSGIVLKGARVAILGLTFKENVSDLRNSRVPDIVRELKEFGIEPLVHDPLGDPEVAKEHYGITLSNWESMQKLDALVLAVPHREYLKRPAGEFAAMVRPGGMLADLKSALDRQALGANVSYWSL
ncbi:MAG: nucleotide sugar dehydrogenase [Deltaproteobacteria bacterium]|nr:nucleotide sugar dehydrogenase [Deltaproteobacteria bacterium]